jgi:hypothetical protein
MSVRPCAWPYALTRLPLDGFSWNWGVLLKCVETVQLTGASCEDIRTFMAVFVADSTVLAGVRVVTQMRFVLRTCLSYFHTDMRYPNLWHLVSYGWLYRAGGNDITTLLQYLVSRVTRLCVSWLCSWQTCCTKNRWDRHCVRIWQIYSDPALASNHYRNRKVWMTQNTARYVWSSEQTNYFTKQHSLTGICNADSVCFLQGKVKVRPRRGHEGPGGGVEV